jgi:hypothetical protein
MNQAMLRTDQPPVQIVQALERGERLRWHGAPRGGLRLGRVDRFLIPFSPLFVRARDDSGSISFGSAPPFAAVSGGVAGWPGSGRMQPPQFEMTDDVAAVAALVREAQRHAT